MDESKPATPSYALEATLDAISRSQAIIEFDLDGTILHANENFCSTVGYELHEIVGKHHRIFVDPAEAASQAYTDFWRRLAGGSFDAGAYKRRGKGGREIWIQASYNPVLGLHGQPFKVVKFATDITEAHRRQAEAAGQVEAISKAQAVIAFATDGTILDANENFLAAVGYTLDEIVGQHHRMFVAPEERESEAYEAFWASLREGTYDAGAYRRIAKGGREIWIQASYNPILDTDGRPFKVVKFATDITEERLRNADFEGQLRAISKTQAVIEFELDGTIRTANANFLGAVGYALDEIVGKHHRIFVDAEYAASGEYSSFWRRLAAGEAFSSEYRRIRKDGSDLWIQASYNPILDADGRPFKVVKYATDVTARKLAVNAIENSILGLSEGDLGRRIEQAVDPDFEALRAALNGTLDRLQDLVEQIDASSTQVAHSAAEVAQGSGDLRERTEEQSNALMQTSTTVEELTITVRTNADSSQRANDLASSAQQCAEDGGKVMGRAVDAMNGIKDASEQISNIIAVIDEIAFQTNLVALNAAVEAARAGDQGRGFAVVAGEVRNLAQQSADAAKEIKRLIRTSVDRVSEGGSLVTRSGDSLQRIVSEVRQVNQLIDEIATGSAQQAAAIEEVNAVVQQLQNNTQHNAAMVAETAAAASVMDREAQTMAKVMTFFRRNPAPQDPPGQSGQGGQNGPAATPEPASAT